jgi:hypothetical protein
MRTFEQDRVLLAATVVLALCACFPLFLTPFLPFCDLPLNTAQAELLWDALLGRLPAAAHHQVNWAPVPYWTGYLLAMLLGRLVGPLVAAKVLTALVLVWLPLSMMRLLLALKRDPRLGLWTFGLVWQQNLYAGWMAFMLAICLVSYVLARLIEAKTIQDGLRLAPLTALVAVTHVQGTALLGLTAIALTLTTGRFLHRFCVHGAAGLGAAAVTAAWLLIPLSSNAPQTGGAGLSFGWHSPAQKLSQFFYYTIDNFSWPEGERAAAITFVVMVLGPLLLSVLPSRFVFDRRSPLALVAVAGGLYSLLWWEINGAIAHWYTYPRYAVVTVLYMALVPAPRLRGMYALALLPGVLGALWVDYAVVQQFIAFGAQTRPLLDVIARVAPRTSVLPIVLDDADRDPFVKVPGPYHQLFAYVTAVTRGYSPYLWNNRANPLYYAGPQLPAPGWDGAFSMSQYGSKYDYVLVQGFQKGDPLTNPESPNEKRPRLLLQSGRWRLYAVH